MTKPKPTREQCIAEAAAVFAAACDRMDLEMRDAARRAAAQGLVLEPGEYFDPHFVDGRAFGRVRSSSEATRDLEPHP